MIGKQAVVGFVVGAGFSAGVAVMLQSGREPSVSEQRVAESPAKPREVKVAKLANTGPSAALLETKKSLVESYGKKREELLAGMSAGDIKGMIKNIEGDANFIDGLDYSSESALKSLLNELAKQGVGEMVSWVKSEYPPKLSDKILTDWFKRQDLMPRREAFDIADNYMSKEGLADLAGYYLTSSMKQKLASDEALFYLEHLKVENGGVGSDVKFSEGFAYKAFAERSIERLIEGKENGSYLSSYPSNFFTEWVKRDRDAAFAFYDENLYEKDYSLPFNEYPDLIEGYVEDAPIDESAPWLVDVLNAGDLKREEYQAVIKMLAKQEMGGIGFTEKLLQASPDPIALKAEMVTESFGWSDREDRFKKALKGFDSFEQYLEGAERAIRSDSPAYRYRDSALIKQMENLQRPQAEINHIKSVFEQVTEERRQKRYAETRKSRSQK